MALFRGAGGGVFEMDTPTLAQPLERFVGKIVAGELVLLDGDAGVPAEEALARLFPAQDTPGDDRPPTKGKGSGRAAWAAYAEQLGLDVDGLDRDAIVALVDGAPDTPAPAEDTPGDDEDQDDDEDGSYVLPDA